MAVFRSRIVFLFLTALGCGENSPSTEPSVGGAVGSGATGALGSSDAGSPTIGGIGGSAGNASDLGGTGGNVDTNAGSAGMSGELGAGAGSGGATGTAGASGRGGAAGSGFGAAGSSAGNAGGAGSGGTSSGCGAVTAVPESVRTRLRLDPFYQKHVDANGVPVLASNAPADEALILACELLNNMLSKRDDVRSELIRRRARFVIIGKSEGTAEIPEYGYRDRPQAEIDAINQRARGLGGLAASCGEENILCLKGDRYPRESICVHEFSHTITTYGAYSADSSFQDELEAAYQSALESGILDRTYRRENLQEYWAEGVQDWYDTNDFANPPNGIHNQVNTRAELADYDPKLYALVSSMFPEATSWGDCHVTP